MLTANNITIRHRILKYLFIVKGKVFSLNLMVQIAVYFFLLCIFRKLDSGRKAEARSKNYSLFSLFRLSNRNWTDPIRKKVEKEDLSSHSHFFLLNWKLQNRLANPQANKSLIFQSRCLLSLGLCNAHLSLWKG